MATKLNGDGRKPPTAATNLIGKLGLFTAPVAATT